MLEVTYSLPAEVPSSAEHPISQGSAEPLTWYQADPPLTQKGTAWSAPAVLPFYIP